MLLGEQLDYMSRERQIDGLTIVYGYLLLIEYIHH